MSEELDCQKCGACCTDQLVLLMPDDDVPFHLQGVGIRGEGTMPGDVLLAAREKFGEVRCMKIVNGRCAALTGRLGVSVTCEIYNNRPKMCAVFEKGSPSCLEVRAQWHLG